MKITLILIYFCNLSGIDMLNAIFTKKFHILSFHYK